MVHSVELLFDAESDTAVREIWDSLADNGIRSLAGHRSPSNRPHVTVTVAGHMHDAVDQALRPLLDRLPLDCVIGAPLLFGGARSVTLARLIVPSPDLLRLHADVHDACLAYMPEGSLPHADLGHWTPHVTLARRVPLDQLATAVSVPGVSGDIRARLVGLRHWDGDLKLVHPIG